MSDFSIPHLPPIRFVKSLLYSDYSKASVEVTFDEVPTLAMLVEAAAQSSSGIEDDSDEARMGFLVSLKNVKLLQDLKSLKYNINIELVHKIENFKSLSFDVRSDIDTVATGAFSIIIK